MGKRKIILVYDDSASIFADENTDEGFDEDWNVADGVQVTADVAFDTGDAVNYSDYGNLC